MALILPNPTVPTNGQPLDATPLAANINAIVQAIQSFDGTQIAAGTVTAAAFNANINPNTILNETMFPFIKTGLVWSIISGLNGGMTSGTMYYNGIRVTVNSVSTHAFTASSDTYIDIDVNGNIVYQAVTNNAASPALTASSIRVAIVVTSGSAITFVNQGQSDGSVSGFAPVVSSAYLSVTDTLGNLIYPADPNRRLLGYRQIFSNFVSGTNATTDVTGLFVPVIVPAGRKITIRFIGDLYNASAAFSNVGLIREGSTSLASFLNPVSAANYPAEVAVEATATPTAGLHTYKISINSNGGNTAVQVSSTFEAPFIKVELI